MPAEPAVAANDAPEGAFRPSAVGTLESAHRAVNSLGIAFATSQLFTDPRSQNAFSRAVEELRDAAALKVLEVTDDGFLWGRKIVPAEHPGATRLAVQLFLHNIAAVRFLSPPSGDDLVGLFRCVRQHPENVPEGVATALANGGVSAIRLHIRGMLHESDPNEPAPEAEATILGKPHTPETAPFPVEPGFLAAALLREAGNDRDRLPSLVVDRYLEAAGLVDPEDVWGEEEVVHAFVDAFFHFPREFQAPILAELLIRRDLPPLRTFLDQFARHELHELAPLLDDEVHPLLLEYAKAAADGDERLDELHDLFPGSPASKPIGALIEDQIGDLLSPEDGEQAPVGRAVQRLQAEIPLQATALDAAADVLSELLEMASSETDLMRCLRIWARKVTSAIETDDIEAANTWISVVYDRNALAVTVTQMATVLRDAAASATVLHLVEAYQGTELRESEGMARILPFIPDAIIECLGDEPDQRRRRIIIDMLTIAARHDAEPLVRRLHDPRWYLVRNLIMVAGRSRSPELAEIIRPYAQHPDPRVRREALRSIHALGGGGQDLALEGLRDHEKSVRAVATTIIRTAPSPEVIPLLAGLIDTGISTEAKCDVIALLGQLPYDDARAVLKRLAARRISASSATRALRTAAQATLEKAP
jgi:hypothetical protein